MGRSPFITTMDTSLPAGATRRQALWRHRLVRGSLQPLSTAMTSFRHAPLIGWGQYFFAQQLGDAWRPALTRRRILAPVLDDQRQAALPQSGELLAVDDVPNCRDRTVEKLGSGTDP